MRSLPFEEREDCYTGSVLIRAFIIVLLIIFLGILFA